MQVWRTSNMGGGQNQLYKNRMGKKSSGQHPTRVHMESQIGLLSGPDSRCRLYGRGLRCERRLLREGTG